MLASSAHFTAVQISDCHLNPEDPACLARFESLRERVALERPDLIIVSGDVSDDGYRWAGQFEYARDAFAHWPAEVLVIPGNHDIGDKAGEANEIKPSYLSRWNKIFGADRFRVQRDGWMILGLNSQIIGSGLPAEDEQFAWLDDALQVAERDGWQVAVFLHAAAYLLEPDEVFTGGSRYWGFDPKPRRILIERLHRPCVRLVANGHLHWHQIFERHGAKWVWCPSQYLIVDDAIFPRGGGVTGFLRYDFDAMEVSISLIELETPTHTIHVFRPIVESPGCEPITVAEILIDATAVPCTSGRPNDAVVNHLARLAEHTRLTVLTARDHETAPVFPTHSRVETQCVRDVAEKQYHLETLGAHHTVVITRHAEDAALLDSAAIGIAIIETDGSDPRLRNAANVVVENLESALDLIEHPESLASHLKG